MKYLPTLLALAFNASAAVSPNVLFLFTDDHRYDTIHALGSHGLTGKQNVYEHSVRVPLIVRGPGVPKGEIRTQLCYLYDIHPTLCDRAGLKIPDTVQFRSLSPVIADPKAVHREHLYFGFMQWQRAVRDGRHKLIEFCVNGTRTTRLFDLHTDPSETRDLSTDETMKPVLTRLRALLEKESLHLNDRTPQPAHIRNMSDSFWTTYEAGAK